ncbi:MAG TPA: ABC transporter ATP-binding protein [Sphingomonadaceae bacterium]|nr:ABC transporter ATP-binding protein [Sphingomonadaceae bacterium]
MTAPAVEFIAASCAFPPRKPGDPEYVAVRDVSLTIAEGEFMAVVGPTGCGKSTLLNAVAGIRPPSSGEVRVRGQKVTDIQSACGYLFQSDTLLPWLTARENVRLGLTYRGVSRKEADPQVDDWLHRVGLDGAGDRYPYQLSGGMKKRVSLAQTLLLDPQIILMDEPFSALDVQTRHMMENQLLDIWAANRKTVLFVTHDLEEAISLADRVVVLSAGPGSHPVRTFDINIPRPRDVTEIVHTPDYIGLHAQIWATLKEQVLMNYQRAN